MDECPGCTCWQGLAPCSHCMHSFECARCGEVASECNLPTCAKGGDCVDEYFTWKPELVRYQGVWTWSIGNIMFKGRKMRKHCVMNPRALRIGRWEIVAGVRYS